MVVQRPHCPGGEFCAILMGVFGDAGPMLRSHRVNNLQDRVLLIRKLIWYGEAAFNRRLPPRGGLLDPQMRQLGLMVTAGCRARNDMCELESIYRFVTAKAPDGYPNVRYTGDITDKDTFQSALRTLQYRGGDCDDHTALCAVLAMENGFRTRARITSNEGVSWDHIYCLAGLPKGNPTRWIALDTTLPGYRFNQHPPQAKHQDFDLDEPK